jgi:hypothetical protein
MRHLELFEGRLLLVDIFAGFVVAKIGTADTDWDRPSAVRFEKQWMLVGVLVVVAVTSRSAMPEDRLC